MDDQERTRLYEKEQELWQTAPTLINKSQYVALELDNLRRSVEDKTVLLEVMLKEASKCIDEAEAIQKIINPKTPWWARFNKENNNG